MARIDLCVPFSQKDEAKALGAKWDAVQKIWYVPDGVDAKLFSKWTGCLGDDSPPNVRAKSYYIAEASRECWKCNKRSRVYAFVLPAGFEALCETEEEDMSSWMKYSQPTFLSYITRFPEHAQQAIKSVTDKYFLDTSSMTTPMAYWMNHCEHCRARLGDFETMEEYDSPFSPLGPEEARQITLWHFDQPFEGIASYSEFDSSIRHSAHQLNLLNIID
jgi:hypothetical protein